MKMPNCLTPNSEVEPHGPWLVEANCLAPYSRYIIARRRLHAGGRNDLAPIFVKHPNYRSFLKSPTPIVLDNMIYLFLMHFVGK